MTADEIKQAHRLEVHIESLGAKIIGSGRERTTNRCAMTEHKPEHLCVTVNVEKQVWHCNDCGQGGDIITWIAIQTGKSVGDVIKELGGNGNGAASEIVATYPYHDASGKVRFEVVRYAHKSFRQRRPDGKGGWIWNMQGVERVLYRFPELVRDMTRGLPVFIVEGEKDVAALVKQGLTATCNAGGAGKWQDSYSEILRDADVIVIADKDEPGRKHAEFVADKLHGIAKRTRVLELPDIAGKAVKDAHDFFMAGGDVGQLQDLVDHAADWTPQASALMRLIKEREFNYLIEPPPLRPIYTLAGFPISTPANLTTITSAIKTGKSAVVGAMAAAAMPHNQDADLLGFSSSNPKEMALLWFDSEQSPDDFWHGVYRSVKRAGLREPPAWLHPYCLTGLGCKRAWECVTEATRAGADRHGGIQSILIDGLADLVADVNDAEESNAFVATLHDMAIQRDCPIIGVIHFNPGSEKSRGHLGSQVERKAETNLALEKDADQTTVIYSTKNRRAGIPKNLGPRFTFSAEAGMHVSVESRHDATEQEEIERLRMLADDLFLDHPAMHYTDLVTTAKKRLGRLSELNIIRKSVAGLWIKGT
jgi:5S rRNA maturation endonuclease (ribonuclease M5)